MSSAAAPEQGSGDFLPPRMRRGEENQSQTAAYLDFNLT